MSKFISNINIDWQKFLRRLVFVLVATTIIVSAGLTLININNHVYENKETVNGKVLIDVSVSDTLTRGIDDKLNRVLQDLIQIKQDSVAVEVRKVYNPKQQ